MKYVILNESNEPIGLVFSDTTLPPNSLPCPEAARDHSEITIADVDDGSGGTKKEAQLDPAKVAAYDLVLNAQNDVDLEAQAIAKKKQRLNFGMDLKAEVMVINDTKGWSNAEWILYRENASIQSLSALLVDGYLQTAKDLLVATDLTAFYTVEEKQGIVDKITDYLNNE